VGILHFTMLAIAIVWVLSIPFILGWLKMVLGPFYMFNKLSYYEKKSGNRLSNGCWRRIKKCCDYLSFRSYSCCACAFLFKPFTGMIVDGSLKAEGTLQNPVVFTTVNDGKYNPNSRQLPNPFDWNGIQVSAGIILPFTIWPGT
jgi:hypothetical protein